MSEIPPSVIEHLRVALLDEIRTLAESLHSISDDIDREFAGTSPNLGPAQNRFLNLMLSSQAGTRLHARIGTPGEPIASWMLTFQDSEERDLALEILHNRRAQLFTRLISDAVQMPEKEKLVDGIRLISDFLSVAAVDPKAPLDLRRRAGGHE